MPTISFPTHDIKYFHQTNVFVRGDQVSVDQYAIDNGLSGVTNVVLEEQRFSNNGGITYQYFMTSGATWVTEYGYEQVIVSLDHD